MSNGDEKQQTKSDKQKRCLLCNRDDFTLNPFDQNDANDVKTLFDADVIMVPFLLLTSFHCTHFDMYFVCSCIFMSILECI